MLLFVASLDSRQPKIRFHVTDAELVEWEVGWKVHYPDISLAYSVTSLLFSFYLFILSLEEQ